MFKSNSKQWLSKSASSALTGGTSTCGGALRTLLHLKCNSGIVVTADMLCDVLKEDSSQFGDSIGKDVTVTVSKNLLEWSDTGGL